MTNVHKNSTKLTREDLKIAPESPTMELSGTCSSMRIFCQKFHRNF